MADPSEAGVTPPIRVLVVDDHPVVREGLVALLTVPGIEVAGEAATGAEAVEAFRRLAPDVLLVDLRLPGMSGTEAIRRIRAEAPTARALVLTTYEGDAWVREALDAGAAGYLLKDAPAGTILDAIRRIAAGERTFAPDLLAGAEREAAARKLSPREAEVLALLATGLRNREIATRLGLSEATVKLHVHSLLAKLGAKDRTEAAAIAGRRGLLRS